MNKKTARKKKKLRSAVRNHRVLPNGRILTADGRETLLGNLAPVKKLPMLPWKHIIVLPTCVKTISVNTGGELAWFYRLLKKIKGQPHDMIGFLPVDELDADGFVEKTVGKTGIAAQVYDIEEPENGRANVHLKGICRFEITHFLPSDEDHFWVNIHWFDDQRDADAMVRPQYEKCLTMMEDMFRRMDTENKYPAISKKMPYFYEAAQAMSYIMGGGFEHWFTKEEWRKIFDMRSVAARLKLFNDRSEEKYGEDFDDAEE